jgi:peptidoglycan/xylan/chitin deacetylase (PgdA/CDA1 family)
MNEQSPDIKSHMHVPDGVKRVWLTFDDGPHPQHTLTILDTLKVQNVFATFFVLGKNVKKTGKTLLHRAQGEGHSIGNHTFSHRKLTNLSEKEIEQEIESTESLIAEFLEPEKLFRPPYGATNDTVDRVTTRLGYRTVLWDVDTSDWDPEYQSNRWTQHGLEQIRRRENAVVLAHDNHATTAAHIGEFIQCLRKLGVVLCGSFGGSPPAVYPEIKGCSPPSAAAASDQRIGAGN